MKLSHATSLLLLLGVVSAVPSGLEVRADPPMDPITVSKAEVQLLLQMPRC